MLLFRDNGIIHPLMYLTTILSIALMAYSDDRAIQAAGAVLLIATIVSPMVRSWREAPPTNRPKTQQSVDTKAHRISGSKES